jgi:hypothetical protein
LYVRDAASVCVPPATPLIVIEPSVAVLHVMFVFDGVAVTTVGSKMVCVETSVEHDGAVPTACAMTNTSYVPAPRPENNPDTCGPIAVEPPCLTIAY